MNGNLLLTFLSGGSIVATVSYLSDYVSNNIAVLLWAFPFTIIPTLYYFHLQKKAAAHIYDFLHKCIYSIGFLCLNMGILYLIYRRTADLVLSLALMLVFYIIASAAILNIIGY